MGDHQREDVRQLVISDSLSRLQGSGDKTIDKTRSVQLSSKRFHNGKEMKNSWRARSGLSKTRWEGTCMFEGKREASGEGEMDAGERDSVRARICGLSRGEGTVPPLGLRIP